MCVCVCVCVCVILSKEAVLYLQTAVEMLQAKS